MPRDPITGVFTRVANSFSEPSQTTIIDPADAAELFDEYDAALNTAITDDFNFGAYSQWDSSGIRLVLRKDANTFPVQTSTSSLAIFGPDPGEARLDLMACDGDGVVFCGRVNGTWAAPTVVTAGQQILGLTGGSIDTNGSTTIQQGGGIGGYALNTWSSTDHSWYWDIYTIPSGSTSFNTASRFHASGGFSVNTISDPGTGVVSSTQGFLFPSFTVATLPAGVPGQVVYCSDARVFNLATGVQQGAGTGTGSIVVKNATQWVLPSSNTVAVA